MGTMIDSTGGELNALVAALGGHWPQTIASYVTGSNGVPATASQLDALVGKTGVFRYDQTPGLLSFAEGVADAADIEPQAGVFSAAVAATQKRMAHGWDSWWYVNGASTDPAFSLAAARAQVADNKLTKVQFIVANWNFNQAEAQAFLDANADVSGVQWASPSSNPTTLVPGTTKTLAELNVDLNVVSPGWFAVTQPTKPTTTVHGIVVTAGLVSMPVSSTDNKTWTT